MSEQEHQHTDKPKRPRASQSARRAGKKQTQQVTPGSTPEQKSATPLVPPPPSDTTASQPVPTPEASPRPMPPPEPPIGNKWGEFPWVERRAELKERLEQWEQEPDHRDRSGPFAHVELSGADVYWLAALMAGEGDVAIGSEKIRPPSMKIDFSNLHLEGASLCMAPLEGASLWRAHLEGADLTWAHLEGAFLTEAHLEGAVLQGVHLEGASLDRAHLEGAVLERAYLAGASLTEAHLAGAFLNKAHLEGADLSGAHLEEAFLIEAHLAGALFTQAHLTGAYLTEAHLEEACLVGAHLEGTDLSEAHLTSQMDLREATFDAKTQLVQARLDGTIQVADVAWNGVPLMRLDWRQVPRLGDEGNARQVHADKGKRKDNGQWIEDFETAERAYRQLAIVLRGQGITEAADRFTYRALIMQRKALWWQLRNRKFGKLGSYLFSLFLAVLTGYGFRMWRIIVAYALLNLAFAGTYWLLDLDRDPQPFSFWQAIILSVTAFHGRVFSNPFNLSDPQIVVTAMEAILGLVIEGVFIAMLTQRFFNR